MTSSIEFVKEWLKLGKIPALKIGRYGVQSDRTSLYPINTRNLYRLAASAWRLSVNDRVAKDADDQRLVDTYLTALLALDVKTGLKAQPDYVGIHAPWVRDTSVHYDPRFWLNKLIGKRHANNPF